MVGSLINACLLLLMGRVYATDTKFYQIGDYNCNIGSLDQRNGDIVSLKRADWSDGDNDFFLMPVSMVDIYHEGVKMALRLKNNGDWTIADLRDGEMFGKSYHYHYRRLDPSNMKMHDLGIAFRCVYTTSTTTTTTTTSTTTTTTSTTTTTTSTTTTTTSTTTATTTTSTTTATTTTAPVSTGCGPSGDCAFDELCIYGVEYCADETFENCVSENEDVGSSLIQYRREGSETGVCMKAVSRGEYCDESNVCMQGVCMMNECVDCIGGHISCPENQQCVSYTLYCDKDHENCDANTKVSGWPEDGTIGAYNYRLPRDGQSGRCRDVVEYGETCHYFDYCPSGWCNSESRCQPKCGDGPGCGSKVCFENKYCVQPCDHKFDCGSESCLSIEYCDSTYKHCLFKENEYHPNIKYRNVEESFTGNCRQTVMDGAPCNELVGCISGYCTEGFCETIEMGDHETPLRVHASF